jgi:hypothetical protein
MASTNRNFLQAMASLWGAGYWVTWPPITRLRLGEIGTASGVAFVPITTLAECGIASAPSAADTRDHLTYRSEGSVDVTFKVSGQTSQLFQSLAEAQAGALVRFAKNDGVLVAYSGLAEHRLASQPVLAQEILRRYWLAEWPLDWAVASHVVTAAAGTVLVAGRNSAAVELAAGAALGAGPLQLADLATGVTVARSAGLNLELVGADLTPFFRILRLRKRFMRGVEAAYGDKLPLRTGAGRPAEVPLELLEEARDDPDAVLEAPPQPSGDQPGDG